MKSSHVTHHDSHIRSAISIAKNAKHNGNHPFGALLVLDNEIILQAENTVHTDSNPTCHAEMNLINLAWKTGLSKEIIGNSTLYTSCEPCPMCTGAIFWSGIRKVVFSLPATTLGEIANDKFCVPCTNIFSNSDTSTEVIGPILPEESVVDHIGFWV